MDNQLKKQIEINDRNIFSPEQKKYSVYLPKYGITVQTALTDAREIMFSTEISALKQSRDLYFALGRMGESKKDFTNGFFKQAAKGLGASAVNIAGNLYGAAVNLGWKGVNEVALQWTRANKAAEVSTQEELAFATKVDKAKYEEAERAREAWTKRQRADLQDFMQKAGLDKTQFDGFVYDLISGGGTAVAALAVGAITKSPGAVAAMFGAVSGQDYYGEALEAGLAGDKALAVGFGAGSLDGLLERYGTQQLFKAMVSTSAFKTPIRAIMRYARQKGVYGVAEAAARGAVTEGAEEFTQNIASSAVMNAAGVRDDSYDEIIAESFYGAILGALVGGGMAGAGRAAALAASKLEKAGMPKDIANDVAGKIIEQAYEKESIEEAIKLAESENSPLTYENSDKAAAARKFAEQVRDFADPEKRARAAREVWNIKDAVEKEALKAGLSPEQAATAAQAYQSAANMYFYNTGVMPKDWWEQYRLEIQNDMQKRAGGKESDTFYQAAMYKNPRTDIKEFVDFVLSGQERKKSYFSFETKSGELWRVPGDTVIHDKKRHPDITKKDWEVLLDNFNKSKFYYPKNPQPVFAGNPYYGVFEHNGQNYGFIFEVLDSGERQVSSLFKNTKNGIEAFIKEKAANALEPLLQSSQLAFNKESGADFVGRPKDSITKEGQKDNRFGQGEADGERFYQAAAMYKTPHKDFKDFYNAAQNNKGKKQSYYTYSAKSGVDIDIPSDTLLHDKKHPEMTAVEWEKVLGNIDNIERAFAVNGKENARYKGQPVLMKISDDNNAYGVVLEILNNGRILLTTAFKSTGENGADAWLTKEKSAATPDTFIFDFRLTTDKSRRAAFYGRSSSYSLSDIAEAVKTQGKQKAANALKPFGLLDSQLTASNASLAAGDFVGLPKDSITKESQKDNRFGQGEADGERFYQAAAMYKSRAKNLVEFKKNARENRKSNRKQFYSIKGSNIDIAQDSIISDKNKGLTNEDLDVIEKSLENPSIKSFSILDDKGSYNGKSVILNIKTAKGNLAVLIEVAESERILFKEASFKEPIQNRAGMHTFTDNAASPGHIYSIDDVIDAVNMEYEKSISQKSVSELEKIINSLNENITNKQKRVYDKHNFYKKTINDFKNAQAPKRLPDYVSASGSKYWIEKGGVYRQSDHWGKVSTNEWTLDGKESVEAEKTGYARWQDFGYNGAQDKARLAKYEHVLKRKGVVATEGEKDNRFNQAPAEGARGYVEFTGQGVFMRLLEEADPSTVVHEVCGHVLLRNVEDIKSFAEVNGGAREEFNGIWEDLEKWLGPAERVEEDGKVKYRFSRAQQEMFAEGMEKMFAAGKAPTGTLEKIFKYFRDMLSAMYAEAREWLNLRPEVEELFGKILAGTQIESADSKIYKGRAADVKAVSARARKGEAASINGLGIKEVKALIKQLGRRRPSMPKEDLLTVLKRKGADYANAAKIDAEAYANAGVKDKAGGIKDDAALWLKEEGFAVDISEEQAWALIEKALDGEKVYRPEDMERIAAIENFDANIEAIREVFGGNVKEAEETLRAIEDLEAKGYRVIGNSDVEYAEEQTGKLLSYFERERELKKQIANLTEDKEELGNIAERRLKEISRRAALAREEGYKEAIKDAQDKKTVKDLLAVEREAEKNALDARRVKNALIEELGKRELLGKEEMLKALKEAQGTEEITSAAVKLISALHKNFGETQEGQAEKRKTDLPGTNWAQVKVKALGNFGKTLKEAGADVKRAQALEKQASAARLKGIKLDEKMQAQVDNARSKVLKGYALKYARALKEAFAGVPHIDGVWLDKAANAIGREYAGRENIIGRPLDQLIERAKKRQAENYKRYLGEKIEKIISAGYKVKDGQKQKGKYDYVTNKLFEDLAHIKNMDKTAAKAELERRNAIINDAPSNAEAALKIFELEGEAENVSPDYVENMKFENAWLAFKARKMSDKEMAMAKESLAEQGLPDEIGEDRWHNVTPEFLSEFYKELTQRRQAALEGRLSKSAEVAFKVREEREAYAKAVRENGKAGFLTKGYINHVANFESVNNAFANKETAVKYSLLNEEAQAEVKTSEKMKEIVRQVSETLGAKDANAVKKWFDGLDEEAGVWQNRMESKRMALQEAAPAVRQQMEAVDEFRKLLSGKEEIILKDFLSFTDAHGERKNHNLKIAFDGKDGGLKSIFEEQGYEGVMKAVHAALKGLIVKNDGNTVFIRVRNDFAAVLKYSNPGGKATYTLVDYALFDEKGRQTAGYGIDGENKIKGDTFFQAAMYKTPHKEFKSFYNAAQNAKGGKQSYYTYTTSAGINIDIPSDTILHDKKHPEMTAKEWIKGLSCIDDIEDSFYTKPRFSNGIGILLKVKGKGCKYGAEITLTPSGRVILNTMFRSTDEGINAWIQKEKENAGMSAPLRRGQASRSEDVISSRSPLYSLADILKNANRQKDTFLQGKKENIINTENAQKKADVNSKETAFEVKKAALNAAQNALNPYMDGIYKPVAQKLTKGQIIDIYNMAKNPVGYARLENQYGYDQLTEMFSLLSKEDKQIADHWQKTVEEGHGEINKVFIKQYGLDMGSPAHYWPFSVERITSEVDMLGQNYAEARRPGLTKSRTSGQLVEMKPMNPVEKLYKHYGRAMQYVHTAEKVSWLRRVLRDSKIKKTIEEHFGEDAAKTLYELLDNSTMGVGKNSVKHYEDGVMNWLTNNYVKAAIAVKPSIALKQLISVVNYAENMPAGQWAEGFVKALGDFKNTIDFMMQDPYLKTRWENGTQNEALMRALAQDFGKTKGVKALNSFTNILAINVRLGDIGAIIFGGKPYIDYLMNTKGMSKEEAFKQFRLDTLRSQQASQRSSLSRLQAKEMNWLMRALFAFKNTANQYVRKIADAIIMYKRGEIDGKQLAKTIAIYGVINQYLYVAATSLGVLGAAYAGFDDEDKNREMLAEFMLWPAQNFGFLPILDDAVNQASYRLTNLALGGKAGALRNPEVPLIKDVYDAVRSLGKDDLTFEDWVNAAAPLAQTATGLPVKYFASAAKTPYELAEGNFTKTALILGGWSEKRAEKTTAAE